ncbi:ATP-binding cassette domain-containing protein [Spirillospora sp. NPDC048911]|uniref:ATP-binding cassette domain-containing protein n=1 Tax=Spirillospora sp. NPDC048911 TaxID=3364527 RepID=UPI0037201088
MTSSPATGPSATGAPAAEPRVETAISAVDLHKTYKGPRGDVPAVRGIDLDVRQGEFFGLLGPNGAGKSTTIGMLTTLVVPTAGSAHVCGFDVTEQSVEVKRRIGMVSQGNTLDNDLTAFENLELTWQRSITDRALAPLPVPLLAVQKITAAALQGLLGGLLVFPAVLFIHAEGQAPDVHIANWPLFLLVMITGAWLSAAGGLLLGTLINPQKAQVLFAVILMPITMLGCVYYPWSALDDVRWLQIASLFNPLVYLSEGLRSALTPEVGHMPVWAFLIPLLGGTAAITWFATRTFTKRVLT